MVGLKGVPFPSGPENFTEEVGSRLAERGHDVLVYVRPYVEVGASYRGMTTRRLPSINTKHLDALTHSMLATASATFGPFDVVHFHALGPSLFSLLPRIAGKSTVAQVHGLDWQRAKWSLPAKACLKGAEYATAYFPTKIITISKGLKSYFENRYGKDVTYIPTGVARYEDTPPDLIRQWGLATRSYFLFLARLVPEKGCHYLLDAFDRLDTDKTLVVAGPPSHSKEYSESLHRRASKNVVFTGAVRGQTLHELFSNAYAYVLPSEIEGLPHSLLQAMGFATCVLASDIAANREALGGCGLTFESKNVDDLAAKLQFLLDNESFVDAQRGPSQQRARSEYSWDGVTDRLEQVYVECVAGASRAHA